MAIYTDYNLKVKELMKQIAVMSAYGAGENIVYEAIFVNDNKGVANIKDHGAGLMWDWYAFTYKIAGDENYEKYER